MGCFFGCFRVKDKPSVQLFSGAVPPKNRDHLVSRNQLAKLLYASEQLDADGSPVPSKGQNPTLGNLVHINSPSSGVSGDENDDERELKKEWHTVGQENFKAIFSSYYHGTHGVISMMLPTRRALTLSNNRWISKVQLSKGQQI